MTNTHIYRYSPNSDEFESVFLSEKVKEEVKRRHNRGFRTLFKYGQSLQAEWDSIVLSTYRGEPGTEKLIKGDFPSLYSTIPVLSYHAWEILEPFIGDEVEALPSTSDAGDPLFLLNILARIDCFNPEKSEVRYRKTSNSLAAVYTYSLDSDKIRDKFIFKIPETQGVETLVTDKFKTVIERENLKGLLFYPLPEAF